ncbi:MAG: cell envelope integrity protein TolA [Gammaproteobacteria bacterium]|nr:cell envelope integrity protein TolA [Gammaproteobacteria bacterium]
MMEMTYKRSLLVSTGIHLGLLCLLLLKPEATQPVLQADMHAKLPEEMSHSAPAPIQAVAVDAHEIETAMQKIEADRQRAKDQELAHQRQLQREVEKAKEAKMAEMKRLQAMQAEAKALQIKQAKMKDEAEKKLQELAKQKQTQEKEIALMKQKQAQEAERLSKLKNQELQKQKLEQEKALAQAQAIKNAQMKAETLAAQQRNAGEVDKYKALILNAIRDQWILPENVNPDLSSQFVIRLAPTGSVLEVRLARSSGDMILDRSAQAAIYKASPLPVPHDAQVFNMFREISLTVRPSNARG